jgi:CHAT domain
MPQLVSEYDELKVRIDSGPGGSYHVLASTDSASVPGSFELPFGEFEIENFVLKVSRSRGRRRIDASALGDAKRFGGPLFRALFREQVNGLYHDALSDARNKGHGLRISLCLNGAPELMDVPWEYLFDEPDFLAASSFTPVVRSLDLARGHRPLRVEPPLRILGVVSSPSDYDELDVERERANLGQALSSVADSGSIELHWLERPSLHALLHRLQNETFHALHFIGHGSYDERADEGVLLFEGEDGRGRPVSGDTLGMILHDFTSLRLAVLNACEGARTSRSDPFAGVAGALVQRDIPAVVAMQFEISDDAAIAFAGGFYEALAMGWPADSSVAAARLAMLADRSDDIEWGTPVLFMRVPDGRLFDLAEPHVKRPAEGDSAPEVAPPSGAEGPATEVPTADRPPTAMPDAEPVIGDSTPAVAPEPVAGDSAPGFGPPPVARSRATVSGPEPLEYRPGDRGPGEPIGGRNGDDHHGGKNGGDPRHARRWRWLLALPVAAVLVGVLLSVLSRSSPSDASVAESWLGATNHGQYVRAASYWAPTGVWTGLKGGTTFMRTPAEVLKQVRRNGKCHKLIQGVTVSSANHVRLRVFIDRHMPGRTCPGVGAAWDEDYSIRDGHINRLIFLPPPGGVQSPAGQSGSNTSGAATSNSRTGSGATTPAGGTATPTAPPPTTSSSAATTTGTVPTPPTSTTP